MFVSFFISSTLRSWLHKISTRIKFCPLDWRTTLLAIFQYNDICQDCWKNTRLTFDCMVILQSRGQGPDCSWSKGQICPVVLHLFWTLSPGFENNHTFECWSGIFPTILENCQNNVSVYGFSQIQGKIFIANCIIFYHVYFHLLFIIILLFDTNHT